MTKNVQTATTVATATKATHNNIKKLKVYFRESKNRSVSK